VVSLEQVRALETRVEKAVALIAALKTENAQLRSQLTSADGRVTELEDQVRLFQQEQGRIEEGILQAIKKLDFFEDAVQAASSQLHTPEARAAPAAVAAKPAEAPAAPEDDFFGAADQAASDSALTDQPALDSVADAAVSAAAEPESADTGQLF